MSIEFLDKNANARLSVESPIRDISGTELYISKFTRPINLSSPLGLFDDSDEASTFYFQRGYEPEVKYILDTAKTKVRRTLKSLGYEFSQNNRKNKNHKVSLVRQNIPSIDTWNTILKAADSELIFSEVDFSTCSNEIAEELYFEDRIISISNSEPWRFHDLAIHTIGHFLISGNMMQDMMNDVYTIRSDNLSLAQRQTNLSESLWSSLDNFTEEMSYNYLYSHDNQYSDKTSDFVNRLSRMIPRQELPSFKEQFMSPGKIEMLTKEILSKTVAFNNIAKK